MMQPSPFRPYFFAVASVLVGCVLIAQAAHGAQLQQFASRDGGIRFKVAASLSSVDRTAAYAQAKASLWVDIRISSEARGARFFGVVAKKFTHVRGNNEQVYWQDKTCHQKRGYPKTTVTSIDGSLDLDGGKKTRVMARTRQIGLPLPDDEITPGKKLPTSGEPHVILAYRSRTKASHLLVDVKIYAFNCELGADGSSGPQSAQR